MNKPFLWIALMALAISLYSRRGGGSGDVDFPNTVISGTTPVKAVPESNKVRVVLFTGTEWCGACKTLESQVIAQPAWREFSAKEIRFRALNFPADQSRITESMKRMAQQYGVRAFPTMLIIGPNSEELGRTVGAGPPVENYKAWIRGHEKFFQGTDLASTKAE